MPSQVAHEVPFLISSEQQQFRLMELPPEIVELLASSGPPRLQFKSSAGGHAALCLPNKTFQLRQVQTSNDVHIMTSKTTSEDRGSEPPRSSIVSIAQCGSSLELAGNSKESAIVHLKQLLPLFEDEDSASDGMAAIRSKSVTFADVPLSDGECEVAWTQLCAFETQDGRFACRPSSRLLVKAWSGILSTAILDRIDLAGSVTRSRLDVLCESIEDVPRPLPQSILERLKADDSNDEATTLDQTKTVEFTGQVLLEDLIEVSTQDFVRQWQNLLPEKWRGQAALDKLSGKYESAGSDKIRASDAVPSKATADTAAAATTAGKRKWHEKFKQARRA
ncbi:putative sister chromatid cohesion protein Dcc1 [Elsinoe australis]|uniref:Putative sister chromatid cohesion protein Dcc1 n=1 Tax=Elsinoe australis TaxID=40998 RepID=A0A4U7AZ82_9PEZI|nr:putative sister chromatid cohesion protein Dcc1 [Elsinoe australis]